jgi:hypothetical protein
MLVATTISGTGENAHGEEHRHAFTIMVNNVPFETSEKRLTGLQIKTLAGIPAEYELFAVHGGKTVPVGDSETVQLHEGAEFRAIPAGTFGRGVRASAATR